MVRASRPVAPAASLEEDFRRTPAAAQPQVWYHWMNGNVTKEGITLDLEPGAGDSGFASLVNGAIKGLPDWYKQGQPKPAGGRVTFTTWQHWCIILQ
jgi:hypothetical protein